MIDLEVNLGRVLTRLPQATDSELAGSDREEVFAVREAKLNIDCKQQHRESEICEYGDNRGSAGSERASQAFCRNAARGNTVTTETVRAVDGIDITIAKGETLGLVGESGCGKSTAGRSILRLIEPTRGEVKLQGQDVLALRGEQLRKLRRRVNIVFQDPFGSLDPRMMIGEIVAEPLKAHGIITDRASRLRRAEELLQTVGLRPEFVSRYPHEFSGGQRQRIGIARAIATDPELIVLDEPISALDISVRAQILNLLADLQDKRGLSYLFIAHDLSVVRHICDRVAVMYLGIIVEQGPSDRVFSFPKHPYTQALLAAVPNPVPGAKHAQRALDGDIPSPVNLPSGCRFRTRCPMAADICMRETPLLRDLGNGHFGACHFASLDT